MLEKRKDKIVQFIVFSTKVLLVSSIGYLYVLVLYGLFK